MKTKVLRSLALLFAYCGLGASAQAATLSTPETVKFHSLDGRTELVAYLFAPGGAGPHPAIVMLHGRAGSYSSLTRGTYTADTLTMRHRMWGNFWAERGYLALHVDSFGPRGYPDGFPKHSYKDRPTVVNEQLIRPLDAYGALAYLRSRGDVIPDRIGLHGWSNGGMTLLAAVGHDAPGMKDPDPVRGFRAAFAQYPSCRHQVSRADYRPYAPMLILAASEDDEVSPEVCRRFSEALRARGFPVDFVLYEGAQHSYDDPGKTKQSHQPNRTALQDSLRRGEAFFAMHLKNEKK